MKNQILTLILLSFIAVACNTARNHEQLQEQTTFRPDTVFASRIDSLKYFAKNGTAVEKMDALNVLAIQYMTSESRLSLRYASDMLRLAQQEKDKRREAIAYSCMTANYSYKENDSALLYGRMTLKLCEELNDEDLIINAKYSITAILAKSQKFDEALQLLQECLDYYTKKEMYLREAYTLFTMGAMYGDMKLNDLAREYNYKVLETLEKMGDKGTSSRIAGATYTNLCGDLIEREEYPEALDYAEKALAICRNLNDTYLIGKALLFRADCMLALDRPDEAFIDLEEADAIAKKLNNNYFDQEVLKGKGRYFMKKKQYQQALVCLKQSLALVDTTVKRNAHIIWQLLAEASVYAGTPDETYEYMQKFTNAAKETFREEWSARMTEMEARYESKKKLLEIEQQKNTINKQNMQRKVLTGEVILSCVILVLLWNMLRLRNRRNRVLTERNEVLDEMNATKDKFFSIVSHDLKNPATALYDALKMLVKNGRSWNTDTLTDYYDELLNSSERLIELIHHLLSWANVQTGRIACTPEQFYLSARLRFEVSQARIMAQKKEVTLNDAIPDDALVTADSNILATVVRNLLTNAIKFTASGGTVTLSVEPAANGKHIIAVSDTGTGIAKEQTGNLFRLDSAVSKTGTAGEQGTGLGLIVCKDLLEKHGTTLHVESEEGKGSRFWFEMG